MEIRSTATTTYLLVARWAAWGLAAGIVLTRAVAGTSTPGEPWLLLITLAQTIALTVYPATPGWRVRSTIRRALPGTVDDLFLIGLTDLLVALVVVFLSGGWGSPYYLFAVTALLVPASVVGLRGLVLLTALFVGGYVLGLSAETNGIHEPWLAGEENNFVAFIAVPFPLAVLVYLVSATSRRLAAEEARTRELLDENIRLQEARERLAAEEERGRIAREIHDGIAQSMYMVSLNLEAATDAAGADSELGRRLGSLVRLAKRTLLEVRQYIFDLRPLLARQETVSAAIRAQVQEFSTISGIPVSVDVVGLETALPMSHGAALYRIAQEALANVYRHAQASAVDVSLAFGPEVVSLQVKDDGIGFDSDTARRGGLRHISERVQELGGSVSVQASPASGAIVTAVLPLNGHGSH